MARKLARGRSKGPGKGPRKKTDGKKASQMRAYNPGLSTRTNKGTQGGSFFDKLAQATADGSKYGLNKYQLADFYRKGWLDKNYNPTFTEKQVRNNPTLLEHYPHELRNIFRPEEKEEDGWLDWLTHLINKGPTKKRKRRNYA